MFDMNHNHLTREWILCPCVCQTPHVNAKTLLCADKCKVIHSYLIRYLFHHALQQLFVVFVFARTPQSIWIWWKTIRISYVFNAKTILLRDAFIRPPPDTRRCQMMKVFVERILSFTHSTPSFSDSTYCVEQMVNWQCAVGSGTKHWMDWSYEFIKYEIISQAGRGRDSLLILISNYLIHFGEMHAAELFLSFHHLLLFQEDAARARWTGSFRIVSIPFNG